MTEIDYRGRHTANLIVAAALALTIGCSSPTRPTPIPQVLDVRVAAFSSASTVMLQVGQAIFVTTPDGLWRVELSGDGWRVLEPNHWLALAAGDSQLTVTQRCASLPCEQVAQWAVTVRVR